MNIEPQNAKETTMKITRIDIEGDSGATGTIERKSGSSTIEVTIRTPRTGDPPSPLAKPLEHANTHGAARGVTNEPLFRGKQTTTFLEKLQALECSAGPFPQPPEKAALSHGSPMEAPWKPQRNSQPIPWIRSIAKRSELSRRGVVRMPPIRAGLFECIQ